jgi:hypothetical protein
MTERRNANTSFDEGRGGLKHGDLSEDLGVDHRILK